MLLLLVRVRPRAILLMVLAVLLADSLIALAMRDRFMVGVSGTDLGSMGMESALTAHASFWISISLFILSLLLAEDYSLCTIHSLALGVYKLYSIPDYW